MTAKTGQKCTAIRRILVPEKKIDQVQKALITKLEKIIIGNPENKDVKMGALASKVQVKRVKKNVELLMESQEKVFDNSQKLNLVDASLEKGAFFSPVLFRNDEPFLKDTVHNIEAFGPVSTLIPYKNMAEAVELVEMGKGSLVTSFVSNNDKKSKEFVVETAHTNGRILVLNSRCSKESTGHGSPMPQLVHGGPGRAGGGEEMGGIRGIKHYLQRTAIQGHPETITKITEQFQIGGNQPESNPHVFRKHFEELNVGDTVFTHKHTVTTADIVNFANVSGDNFYAHMDETSLDGTIFEERVAHGYFLLSKAAGLFVDPAKGPVLLNYGIDECRFTKPVYVGATIGVRFTVKEKIDQKKKDEEDIAKGIVKFLVDIYDETDETVGIATILTMVKKINQNI
jgi:oxepin-CoA hydrolase/3-oxo-5,6-dehydrosuberyl-CoA semialdehyde dehydrogenase